ncbi:MULTISPECIES: hypothetical protein [unclassified Streptomyces]|uniref:hypothetical protein n=1 Tax=unclassified Streptomyces TaxID=2593676 RepID=UPI000A6F463A|nr:MULTISPECIES: hypothetical protein [unclassified Streptomyces]
MRPGIPGRTALLAVKAAHRRPPLRVGRLRRMIVLGRAPVRRFMAGEGRAAEE